MQNAKHFITLLCGLLNVVTEVFFRFKFSTGLATTPLRQRVTMFRHRDLNIFKKILVHEALLRCCVVVVAELTNCHVPSSGLYAKMLSSAQLT